MNKETIEAWLVTNVAAALKTTEAHVDRSRPVTSLGLDSLAMFTLTGDLAEWLGRDLSAMLLWDGPTIETLAEHLAALPDEHVQS